jgi:hypothetical protein
MPSASQKQHNFMAAAMHGGIPGVSKSVGADFVKADAGGPFDKSNSRTAIAHALRTKAPKLPTAKTPQYVGRANPDLGE